MSDEEGSPSLVKTSYDDVEYLENEDTEELFCPITNKVVGSWNDEGGIDWVNNDARDKHELRKKSQWTLYNKNLIFSIFKQKYTPHTRIRLFLCSFTAYLWVSKTSRKLNWFFRLFQVFCFFFEDKIKLKICLF